MTKSFLSFLMAFLSGFSLIFSQTVDTLQGLNDETISLNTFGAISKADAGTFNKGHINHPYDLIRGKIAGLAVSKAGSNPNGFYEMRVRGLRTMDGNSFPAIIIDGVIGAFPENVDPNDIESIALLKDAAAASLYGLRGGSGVLIIETKKGAKGKLLIEYNTFVTAEGVTGKFPAMDAAEWRALKERVGFGTDFGQNTDWRNEITKTAFSQVHNISVSGGGNNTLYRASFNYRDGDGILINTGYSQFNGRINVSGKALRQKLSAGLNLGATQRKAHFGFSDAFKYALLYNPTSPVYSSDPSHERYGGYFQQEQFDYFNPVSIASSNRNEGLTNIMNLTANVSYNIGKGLSVDAIYALENFDVKAIQYFNEIDYWYGLNRNGFAARQEDEGTDRLFIGTIRYNGKIGSGGIINLSAGYTDQKLTFKGLSAEGDHFDINDLSFKNLFDKISMANGLGEVSSSLSNHVINGFTGTAGIDINETLYFRFSGRYEGSSRFGRDNNWNLFGGISASVDLAEVFHSLSIDKLLLRVGYGTAGNLLPENYLSWYRLGSQRNIFHNGYNFPDYQDFNVSPNLKSQVTKEFTAGIDFSLSDSKLSGSFDFYSAMVQDPISIVNVPVPPNIFPFFTINVGKIRDTGFEFSLNYAMGSETGFMYKLNLSASYSLDNRPLSLKGTLNGTALDYGVKNVGNVGTPGNSGIPLVQVEEGKPFGQLITLAFKEFDEQGNMIFRDINYDRSIDQDDRIIAGNALPKSMIGIGNNLTYGKWDLNVLFRGVFGHDMVNIYRAGYESPGMISSYNLPRSATDEIAPERQVFRSSNDYCDLHIENASFLCLDNMSLGFTISPAVGKLIKKFRAYVAGNNLFYLTKYKGIDPNPRYGDTGDIGYDQLIPGIDRMNTWYRSKSITLGANINF